MALPVRRGARTQRDKLEKYIKLQRSLLGETVFTAVQFNSLLGSAARGTPPQGDAEEEEESEMSEQSCGMFTKMRCWQRLHRGTWSTLQREHRPLDWELRFGGKLGLSSEMHPFHEVLLPVRRLYFHPSYHSSTSSFVRSLSPSHHVPLLFPSESVASRRGASEVLIGATLANGRSLEVAPAGGELTSSPQPSFCTRSGGNKGDEVMAGSRTRRS